MKREVAVAAAAATAAATVAGVALLVRQWRRRSHQQLSAQRILREFARRCATPSSKLWHVANELASDMEAELAPGDRSGNLGVPVSYLAGLPTGEEKGIFYGINLRGTDFVIVRAKLEGRNEPLSDVLRQEVEIPPHMLSSAESTPELCDLMALELAKFVSVHIESDSSKGARERILGFTVSLPLASSAIHSKWKRLSVDDAELVEEINRALKKHGVEMRVFAVLNETIGHLAGGRYYSKESVAAVSLGMGTDVAYIESLPQQIVKDSEVAETAINMQWGNFFSSHLPLTEYDASLDAESADPGCRIFEKLISGMYLGEIVRRVLLRMAEESALFGEAVPPKLSRPYSLRSPDMAAMHQDTSQDYEIVQAKLKEIFEIESSSPLVREIVTEICDVVAERGARLVGAGIVGIVKKMGRLANRKSVITIEGGLYEHYRIYRNYLHSSVWEMLGTDLSDNVIIDHSHGGSGAASIFLAASQTDHS
ncbi:probable hexokinase-like 2 protein [Salvia miltiorrhiza]|uniref:probable hexokinase-like 2 protein n=1 Tax=Salvia miltiorrhiza TaxID=226208 RepID=UPI0025AC152A|nr:probable hexokinase-like 2 protein [Salvia miltiorrhiza]